MLFFAHLGVFIGFSSGHCPRVGDFTLGDSSLSLVLGDLYPLLCQSLDLVWVYARSFKEEKYGF